MSKRIVCYGILAVFFGISLAWHAAPAAGPTTAPSPPTTLPAKAPPQDPSVAVPQGVEKTSKRDSYLKQHEDLVNFAKAGHIDVMFLGDSITAGWSGPGKEIWTKTYAPLHAGNFGVGGDETQNVLWRIDNGETVGIHPKVVVLMIGTNNVKPVCDPKAIAGGVTAVVKDLRAKLPDTKILLLGIFPRGQKADVYRDHIKAINTIIAKLDDGKTICYLDIGDKFLQPDGTIAKTIMADFLHPTASGYKIWAEAMHDKLDEMLK
jgi:lysophospholipase L1-like esterase